MNEVVYINVTLFFDRKEFVFAFYVRICLVKKSCSIFLKPELNFCV
jgi:hypothetical protein